MEDVRHIVITKRNGKFSIETNMVLSDVMVASKILDAGIHTQLVANWDDIVDDTPPQEDTPAE